MTKLSLFLAIAAVSPASAAIALDTPVAAQTTAMVTPTIGKMIYSTDGKKLAAVYKIDHGAPQVLIDGRLITIPAATLSEVEGRTATTLTKKDILSAH